jgi:hypothetical protein
VDSLNTSPALLLDWICCINEKAAGPSKVTVDEVRAWKDPREEHC